MSIWSTIVGGAAGLLVGGPLGALVGGVAGHAVGRMRDTLSGADGEPATTRLPTAFSIAVIALGAKMAKADGRVTRDEVDAFKRVFRIPPEDMAAVGHVFNVAKRDASGYERYAEQIAGMFRRAPAVLEELLHALFVIATADARLHDAERAFLARVASIFGFDDATFERIAAMHAVQSEPDAYAVLGLSRDAADADVRATYRALVLEHHPDRLVAQGLPEEFVADASSRMASINVAYESICAERGMK